MARYTGPKTKIARKFGEAIYGEDKVLAKKNYPPGQHGVNRRKKVSEYGTHRRLTRKGYLSLFSHAYHQTSNGSQNGRQGRHNDWLQQLSRTYLAPRSN